MKLLTKMDEWVVAESVGLVCISAVSFCVCFEAAAVEVLSPSLSVVLYHFFIFLLLVLSVDGFGFVINIMAWGFKMTRRSCVFCVFFVCVL